MDKYKIAVYVDDKRADTVYVQSDDELRQRLPKITRKVCRRNKKVNATLIKPKGSDRFTEIRIYYEKSKNKGRRPLPVLASSFAGSKQTSVSWKDNKVYCPIARL